MTDEPTPGYKRLTALVPVFDERNTVAEVVRRLRSLELPGSLELEVLVVDDGSTDGTDKVLRTIEDSTVRVVRHERNKGKGAAIRTGLAEARGDLLLLQEADLEYDPADVPVLLEPLLSGRCKVVYGSRFHPAREAMPLTDVLKDRAVSAAACLLFNTTVTDVESGFKAFDAALLRSLDLQSDGFEIDAEITAKGLRGKTKIYEVPVSYANRPAKRPGSKSRLRALQTLARQRFTSR